MTCWKRVKVNCPIKEESLLNINGKTKLFGIIGNPVSHSLSPIMHNAAFSALSMDCVYVPLPSTDVSSAINGLRTFGFQGVSVTVPHKERVMEFLDEIDPVAEKIGAVNTVLCKREANSRHTTLKGYNTDWLGANRALGKHIDIAGSTAVVVGAGGAAKAVGFGLMSEGAQLTIVNRTREKGQQLAEWLHCDYTALGDLSSMSANILINTTSVGMEPNVEETILAAEYVSHFDVVMDIVYAPLETKLLREARLAGCKTVDGLGMLLYQGIAQFEIWTGCKPPVEHMRNALEQELLARNNR